MHFLYLLIFLSFFACESELIEDNYSCTSVFETFWHELDRNYSFFEYLNYDWDSVYNVYSQLVNDNTTEKELLVYFEEILNLFNDAHTNLYCPDGIFGNTTYFEKYHTNTIDSILNYFNDYNAYSKIYEYGLIKETNFIYIRIKTFDADSKYFNNFHVLLDSFPGSTALILDVRSNKGGKISNTIPILEKLFDSTRYVCKYCYRNGESHTDFSDWIDYSIRSLSDIDYYDRPVIILTDRYSYSATEWFVLSAGVLPNVTIVGDTTGGGSSRPLLRELSNGWILRISNSQTKMFSGSDFQFVGIYPDIPVWLSENDLDNNVDAILEKAIDYLSGK